MVGRGLLASSTSFADKRSLLASSTGPKTLVRSFALLDFLTLDRRPFAIAQVPDGGILKLAVACVNLSEIGERFGLCW